MGSPDSGLVRKLQVFRFLNALFYEFRLCLVNFLGKPLDALVNINVHHGRCFSRIEEVVDLGKFFCFLFVDLSIPGLFVCNVYLVRYR